MARPWLVAVVCLWLAAGCQQGLPDRIAVMGARPDFLLLALGVLGLRMRRTDALLLGFLCGLIQGGLSGSQMTIYVFSRTVAGLVVGWLGSLEVESHAVVTCAAVVVVTIVAQLSVMFMAPPASITAYLLATIGSAMYNGVLAVPFYALQNKLPEARGL